MDKVTFNDLNGSAGTVIDGGAINTNTLKLNSLSYGGLYLSVELGRQMGVKTDFYTAATGTGKAAKT